MPFFGNPRIPLLDLRERRAMGLVHAVMREIEPFLLHEDMRKVQSRIQTLFERDGAEVLTDYDRSTLGLPARADNGWTMEEILAMEERRLRVMMAPLPPVVMPRSAWEDIQKQGSQK